MVLVPVSESKSCMASPTQRRHPYSEQMGRARRRWIKTAICKWLHSQIQGLCYGHCKRIICTSFLLIFASWWSSSIMSYTFIHSMHGLENVSLTDGSAPFPPLSVVIGFFFFPLEFCMSSQSCNIRYHKTCRASCVVLGMLGRVSWCPFSFRMTKCLTSICKAFSCSCTRYVSPTFLVSASNSNGWLGPIFSLCQSWWCRQTKPALQLLSFIAIRLML